MRVASVMRVTGRAHGPYGGENPPSHETEYQKERQHAGEEDEVAWLELVFGDPRRELVLLRRSRQIHPESAVNGAQVSVHGWQREVKVGGVPPLPTGHCLLTLVGGASWHIAAVGSPAQVVEGERSCQPQHHSRPRPRLARAPATQL